MLRALFLGLVGVLASAACSVDITNGGRTAESFSELPSYPGSRPLFDARRSPAVPTVSFTGSFADANVVSRVFESDDTPEAIVDFYRQELEMRRGTVVECRGVVNIRRRGAIGRPVCVEDTSYPFVQLVVGRDRDHRIVAVQRRGSGAEFLLTRVRTR
jgi:hypothetical protein